MLRVHTSDGMTNSFDLQDERQFSKWLEMLRNRQSDIRGLTVSHKGVLYSLPVPQGFNRISFYAECVRPDPTHKIKGGERIVCFADDIRIGMMIHREQKAVRVTLNKPGIRRFDPVFWRDNAKEGPTET